MKETKQVMSFMINCSYKTNVLKQSGGNFMAVKTVGHEND